MVDKPAGRTSHDVVMLVRRRFKTRAVGHTGTLDPFATGLLVMVLGRATRLARFVEMGRKEYEAQVRLGQRTTTDDVTGAPLAQAHSGPWPDRAAVEQVMARFVGGSAQVPPAYSAKRVQGRRSYDLARVGAAVELAPVAVEIDELEIVSYEPPDLRLRAVVGPGTYVRALARDIGDALGIGAHVTELRRTRVGAFDVARATPADRLTGEEPMLAARELLAGWSEVVLDSEDAKRVSRGQAVGTATAEGDRVALIDGGELLAVAEGKEGRWQPVVVLAVDA